MRALCVLALLVSIGCKKRPDVVIGEPPSSADVVAALAPSAPNEGSPSLTTLEDRPLGLQVHFNAIHYLEGIDAPRQIIIKGALRGAGQLELNPNWLTLDSKGRIQGTPLLGWEPIAVQIKSANRPDPDKNGRKVYDIVYGIVPKGREPARGFSLVLSPNEAGPHHLLIREGEKVLGTYPLIDPDRQEHEEMLSKLATTSPREQQAIALLRNTIGYGFHFRVERPKAVTYLHFPTAQDISSLDPALQGLTNLGSLSFRGGRLGPEGLKSFREMPLLKGLSFDDCDIDDEGLACMKDATQLVTLSFCNSRGITDKGLAHLQGLQNLKILDLRYEKCPEEPRGRRISNIGVEYLAGLTKLESLSLQGQFITGEGLRHLSGMTHLEMLSLSYYGSDKGLQHLESLHNLRRLHMSSNLVTPEGLAALKAKLPMLKIGW